MAQLTTALSVLEQRLGEQISDWLEVIVTTAIAANNSIISTNLQTYDGGRDTFREDGWVYITDKANAAVQRQISAYVTSTGTLTVRGAALLTDGANLATIRVHRYDRNKYVQAFNDASRELYGMGIFWKDFDVWELVTGNLLPNSHFRDWNVATVPDKWSLSNVTAAATTTAGLTRGGAKSVKVTASAANGYLLLNSDDYPRLLDLMNQTVSAYVWAYPEVADDATIVLYTQKADGTAQTLTSTTKCPAGQWTLLKLEDQSPNNDIVDFQFRLKVATNAKYVYFDHARLVGMRVYEYLLPTDFVTGKVSNVEIQRGGLAEYACDDLLPRTWTPVHDYEIRSDGTDRWLVLGESWGQNKLIRIQGKAPLTTLSAYTDTIEIGGEMLNSYIAYAEYKLAEAIEKPVATQDIGRYETWAAKAYAKWMRLSSLRMSHTPVRMRIKNY